MNRQQANDAAVAVLKDGWRDPRCTPAYCYTRGCYAVIVYADHGTVVLVDDEAVRMYRANHTRHDKAGSNGA